MLLAERSGLADVAPADVVELAERGVLVRILSPGKYPLVALDLPVGELPAEVVGALREIGRERRAWRAASIDRWDAATAIGVDTKQLDSLASEHGVRPGPFGRFARSDVAKLRTRAG